MKKSGYCQMKECMYWQNAIYCSKCGKSKFPGYGDMKLKMEGEKNEKDNNDNNSDNI